MKKFKFKALKTAFFQHPKWLEFLHWTKTSSLPGFGGVPIYDILLFVRKEAKEDAIVQRANSMAFSFILSLFPATIALFTLLPYLPIKNFIVTMEEYLRNILPAQTEQILISSIRDITDRPRSGLLSLGFILAIFFASNGMLTLLRGFDKGHEIVFLNRSGLQKRAVALKLTALLGLLFILSVALIIVGDVLLVELFKHINASFFTTFAFTLLRWISVIFLFYFGIRIVYTYGPAVKKEHRVTSTGAALATVLSIFTSILFSIYVNNFGIYHKLYGSLGALIVFLTWLQLNAFILIIGFELNASISVNKRLIYNQQLQDKKTV